MSYIIELDVQGTNHEMQKLRHIREVSAHLNKDVAAIIINYLEPELIDLCVKEMLDEQHCAIPHILEYLRFPLSPIFILFEKEFDAYIRSLHKDALITDDQYFEERGKCYKRFGPKLVRRMQKWHEEGAPVIRNDEKTTQLIRSLSKAARLVVHPESADQNVCESFLTSRPLKLDVANEEKMSESFDQVREFVTDLLERRPEPSVLNVQRYTFGSAFMNSYFKMLETVLFQMDEQ